MICSGVDVSHATPTRTVTAATGGGNPGSGGFSVGEAVSVAESVIDRELERESDTVAVSQ